ncbi:MAG: hypothetical protein AVO35_02455 [Candidatus Aegiribacteria sp. MLS_C]|nr:MAG: hypothetical protein AVO35_02455 [Candidatus Aegiribacteria sp. MLS_C]
MTVYKTAYFKYIFILAVLVTLPSHATNFYERHGNNFIYLDNISSTEFDTLTYMPVIWDIRTGAIQLRDYYISYGWDTSTSCEDVKGKVTVRIVVSMEEAALLSPMERIISGIRVYEEHRWRSLKSHLLKGQFRYEILDLRELPNDLPVAIRSTPVLRTQLEAVQRTAASKRITAVAIPGTVRTGGVRLPDYRRIAGIST